MRNKLPRVDRFVKLDAMFAGDKRQFWGGNVAVLGELILRLSMDKQGG